MSKIIFLDTGVIGYVTHPNADAESKDCLEWLITLVDKGVKVCIPEVCDYEIRREYIRRGSSKALQHLQELQDQVVTYIPISTLMMRKAADMWAQSRNMGKPTADLKELDVDVILCAQALLSTENGDELIVATTNVGHLSNYVTASRWREIAV